MDISVVIPSYNGKHLLDVSLPHLYRSIPENISHEIIVVDNGSTDGTDLVISHQSSVVSRYIKLKHNYGFTRAVNEGIKKARGTYVLILNNDCFVEKDTIAALYTFLEKNNNYVATQPIIMKSEIRMSKSENHIENIGYVVDLKKGKAEVVRHQSSAISRQPSVNIWKTGSVYGLSATCLLIRKDIIEKVGMFDESFHSYLEDVDLFIRLAMSGYNYAPCLDVHVTHQHMATSKKM